MEQRPELRLAEEAGQLIVGREVRGRERRKGGRVEGRRLADRGGHDDGLTVPGHANGVGGGHAFLLIKRSD